MNQETTIVDRPSPSLPATSQTVLPLILAISFSHLLNDTIQALLPAVYPVLKANYALSFGQLGLITLAFQTTASLLQPLVGMVTDRRPMPFALPLGMAFTAVGLILLAHAASFTAILVAAMTIGTGSSIFHPEASRIAYMAAGRRRGFAQAVFQVGGNTGSALGPLMAALIIVPRGQHSILAFLGLAFIGLVVLSMIGRWQAGNLHRINPPKRVAKPQEAFSRRTVILAMSVLILLTFSKFIYVASLTDYYTFYLIDRFGVSVQQAQVQLFILLASVAAGTILGGPVGDRIGRKKVIWISILGVAPFTLWLPHAGLNTTIFLSVAIGLILASAFSAILVYAQDLMPGKIGMVSGLFFGIAFGIAGIGSAALGHLADRTSIAYVFKVCAYLPLLGLLAVFLPKIEQDRI